MELKKAIEKIPQGLSRKNLVTVFGECTVDYVGRARISLCALIKKKRFEKVCHIVLLAFQIGKY